MADAVLTDDDKSEGVVHINFGAATTTVVVYQNGYLRHVAVVPFGGKHITNDLANEDCELNITANEAELLKVQKGTPIDNLGANDVNFKMPSKPGTEARLISKRNMIKIIKARLAEIVMLCIEEVKRSGYAEQLRAGIVVTGGASRMADFKEFLEQEIGMPIRFGSFAHYLDAESVEKYSDTEYTLLVGLLLNATEESIQERKVEEPEKNQPIAPKKEKKSSSWKDLFNVKVGTLFDDPEEPTIK
jgi:cell division protein FtsA